MYDLLEGVTVLEVSAYIAAPLAGMTLAQFGATVIKVQSSHGVPDSTRWPLDKEGHSLFWRELNKAKSMVSFDFEQEADRQVFLDLFEKRGRILLTNIPLTGSLSCKALHERYPDAIIVEIQGRPDGSSAVDYTVQPETGLPLITGLGTDGPVNSPLPAWDLTTGYLTATTLLAALARRTRTGQGAYAMIALSDVALATLGNLGMVAEYALNSQARPRLGNAIYGAYGRDFVSADNNRLMIVAITKKQWRALLKIDSLATQVATLEKVQGIDLLDEGERYRQHDAISDLIQGWVGQHTAEQAVSALNDAGVAWAPYRELADVLAAPETFAGGSNLVEQVEQPDVGTVPCIGVPVRLTGDARKPTKPAPQPVRPKSKQ